MSASSGQAEAARRGLGLVLSLGSIAETVEAARLAEEAGFESVWTTEFPDRSATISLAAVAQATSRITVGSAIAYAFGRTPVIHAGEARDLDELSGGRLIWGLGTGTKRMQRDWHGLDGDHPAGRMEELVPLVRRLLSLDQGPVAHQGRFYRLSVHPTAPVPPPRRRDLPIYLGGVNPRMIEAAGRVGDGLVGHPLFTSAYTSEVVRPALEKGAAGRHDLDGPVPIAGYLTCAVDADGDAARQAARTVVAFNSTVKTYRVIHRHHGFEQSADRIREAWDAGDWPAMLEAIPDEMLDAIALAGTPEEVRERFQARRADFDRTLLWPPAFQGIEGVRAVLDAFAG